MFFDTISNWIKAFRLRTLPLSFSLIIVGSALAYERGLFQISIFVAAILTTLFLQILSNVSNDYGDAVSGADYAGRIGPKRAVQSGAISLQSMKRAIVWFALLSLLSGICLLYLALPNLGHSGVLIMLLVGIASIVAAICYTVGKRPYGYRGLGDVSVFVFFGLVGVVGSYVLYSGSMELELLLPASGIGLLSVAVLNMNNMRDYDSDRRAGKNTLIVRMGLSWGRVYQVVIVIGAFVCLAIYAICFGSQWQLLSMLALVRFVPHLRFVFNMENAHNLDTQLKVVSVGTLIVALLFSVGSVMGKHQGFFIYSTFASE